MFTCSNHTINLVTSHLCVCIMNTQLQFVIKRKTHHIVKVHTYESNATLSLINHVYWVGACIANTEKTLLS